MSTATKETMEEGFLGVKEMKALIYADGHLPNQEVEKEQMAIYRSRVRVVLEGTRSG